MSNISNHRAEFDRVILSPLSLGDLEELIRKCVRMEFQEFQASGAEAGDRIIDSKELCSEFNISLPTLIKYRREGLIPFFRVGNRVRFKRAQVINALQAVMKIVR